MIKFVPKSKQDIHIEEFDVNEVLGKITEDDSIVEFANKLPVNMGCPRYKLFAESRICACCGIVGTHMHLDHIEEQGEGYHFNLYAMTKGHMVLMTMDKSGNQTMCYLCNLLKNDCGLTIEQIQSSLFNSYRIYKGTMALNKSKKLMLPLYDQLGRKKRAIGHITEGLDKVKDPEKRLQMEQKVVTIQQQIPEFEKRISDLELEAQTTGLIPQELR